MKRMKKLLAVLLTVAMVMSMGMSVLAAGTDTYTITITGVASEYHLFSAYQIFDGEYDSASGVLSNITWGKSIDEDAIEELITALKGDNTEIATGVTLGSLFTNITYSSADPDASAKAIAEALSSYSDNETAAKALTDIFTATGTNGYLYLTDATATTSGTSPSGSAGSYTYTISGLTAGYYLVTDTLTYAPGATEADNEVVSDYILKVVADVNQAVKNVVPTVSKTVGNNATAVSASAGETVSFTLTGTIPSGITNYYTSYTYKFVDTLSSNLTYDESTSNLTVIASSSGTLTATTNYTVDTESVTGGIQITITIVDAINYAGQTITVTYNATVDSGIASGTAETNKVYVEYSNDPNGSGTGTTTVATVYVHTFDLNLTKTYSSTIPTNHAQFTLYKRVTVSSTEFANGTYYTISGNSATQATAYDGTATYYTLVDTQTIAGSDPYTATFSDLGEGTYVLIESYTPTGYNTADAVTFTITAEYSQDGSSVTNLSTGNSNVTTVSPYTTLSTEIANNAGSSIPVTGSIGTTIFYVVGAVLVLGATVILVTRRRMGNRA